MSTLPLIFLAKTSTLPLIFLAKTSTPSLYYITKGFIVYKRKTTTTNMPYVLLFFAPLEKHNVKVNPPRTAADEGIYWPLTSPTRAGTAWDGLKKRVLSVLERVNDAISVSSGQNPRPSRLRCQKWLKIAFLSKWGKSGSKSDTSCCFSRRSPKTKPSHVLLAVLLAKMSTFKTSGSIQTAKTPLAAGCGGRVRRVGFTLNRE